MENMKRENQICPKCGEELMQCENCEEWGCPVCNDEWRTTNDDALLCPECAAACKEDCDRMRAAGCGSCSQFANENDEGQGWCNLRQEPVSFIDRCENRVPKI